MRLLLGLFILFSIPAFGFTSKKSVETLKSEARNRLLQRKQGFDKHQKRLRDLEKRRLATAYKMKAIRKAHADKKEKARKGFVRKKFHFPKKSYEEFLQKRRDRRQQNEKARVGYKEVRKEVEKVFKNKKYRIDGRREYNLN